MWKSRGDFAAAAQKQPVGELHDVRLVNRRDLLPPQAIRIIERILSDLDGCYARDDFQAGDDVLHHFMLQPGI